MRRSSLSLAIFAVTATGAALSPGLAFGYTLTPPAGTTAHPPVPGLATIEACPYAKLKAAYDAAMTGADTLDVFAIDKEILTVCNERTALIVKLKKGDEELAKLLAPQKPEAPAPATTVPKAQIPTAKTTKTAAAAPSVAKEAPAGTPPAVHEATGSAVHSGTAAALSAPAPASTPAPTAAVCTAKYAMISLAAPAGQKRYSIGGVVDEESGATFTVKAGDSLPGGYTVESVNTRGITLRHAGASQLLPPNTKSYAVPVEGFYGEPVRTQPVKAGTIPALMHK